MKAENVLCLGYGGKIAIMPPEGFNDTRVIVEAFSKASDKHTVTIRVKGISRDDVKIVFE